MRVLFINPSRAGQGNIPINIPLLIAVLKKQGHDIQLFDFSDYAIFDESEDSSTKAFDTMFFKEAHLETKKIMKERQKFYGERFGKVVKGCELKKSDYTKDFVEALESFKPDLVAVSVLSVDFKFIEEFLLPFKKKYRIKVIFGGIHSVLLPEEIITSEVCDFVCIGEGENSFPELLDALDGKRKLNSVKGIWFKENGFHISFKNISTFSVNSN